MVKKIYFPREVIPISYVTSTFVNMLLSFIIIVLAIVFSGIGFNILSILYLPIVMLIEYMFALGFVFILSSITVYFRDVEQITGVILMMWIYLTPIMYDMDFINNEVFKKVLLINPMTPIIIMYHDILYYKQIPQSNHLLTSATIAIILLVLSYFVFVKLDRNFAEEL
jgi:ABC-2 type transport system permease protein